MSEPVDRAGAAKLLLEAQDLLIITHKNPDGDTLGSGFAFWRAFERLGRRARVVCDSTVGAKFSYMTGPHDRSQRDFEPRFILAVDTATLELMGSLADIGQRADLCIDHHRTNEGFAKKLLCDPESASCCEIVADVIELMGLSIEDSYTASCLYTGLSTDTGCFKYRNTTAGTHRLAARLFDAGIDAAGLNQLLFEQKSRGRVELERRAMAEIGFYCGGRVAVIAISQKMMAEAGAVEADFEGITPLPRMIEGVEAGVTLRQLKSGRWKVSLRTNNIDASAVCALFGGGGHRGAAGFESDGPEELIVGRLIAQLEKLL